ncbi:c-type cytochrome [Aquabacter sp. CN5-332]|uniref:c-type cytochrome n=1 Tax=Aquabacter sp. CN5-332 TaxID=3156608 RepID=UPI0032B3A1C4
MRRALLVLALAGLSITAAHGQTQGERILEWDVPQVAMLPDDDYGRLVRFGRSIVEATYAHIGPAALDPSTRYAGNNLACNNCHLRAGLKKFALPLVAASADYPEYSARRGEPATLEERLNSCMTRSMNGRPMPLDAKPMRALVAYLSLLSTNVPADGRVSGGGAGKMAELDRAADPAAGATIYAAKCAECHGKSGDGVKRNPTDMYFGYSVPPLWGYDSFNNGAGMNRLITAANFVHNNMPNGTDWLMPSLSVEESWDVAAYVVSQQRPERAGIEKDFPDLLRKPLDTPYGPYADDFSATQHKYGPFAPIRAAIAKLTAERGTVPNPNAR